MLQKFNYIKWLYSFQEQLWKKDDNLDALHKNEKHINKESQIKS